eukprot:7589529-Alexandrium_andersonii.AAC.1
MRLTNPIVQLLPGRQVPPASELRGLLPSNRHLAVAVAAAGEVYRCTALTYCRNAGSSAKGSEPSE